MLNEINSEQEIQKAFDAMMERAAANTGSSVVALNLLKTAYSGFDHPFRLRSLHNFDRKNLAHAKVLLNLSTIIFRENDFQKYLQENNL